VLKVGEDMQIKINEQTVDVGSDTTLFGLRDRFKPDADVVILNGAPANKDCAADDGPAHTGGS
jgi:sulfur carrier protein ThiS adenylyltransferase